MDWDLYSACVRDLQLPGSPWYEVHSQLSDMLAYRIKLEGLTLDQLNRVSKFVSMKFMRKYHLYDNHKQLNPTLKSSRLSTDAEVQEFLKELTLKSASNCGCSVPVESSADKSFVEMLSLVQNFFRLKISELQTESVNIQEKEQKREALGQNLIQILKHDPRSLSQVMDRLKGQSMPQCVRHYLYRLLTLQKTKASLSNSVLSVPDAESSLTKLRSRFASKVKNGMQDLKLKNPTRTSLHKLISSSVSTAFKNFSGLNEYSEDIDLQQVMCRVLNIIYARGKPFESFFPLWLFPLMQTFDKYESKEKEYEMAMWLDAIIDHFVPSMTVVNQIAFASWQSALKHSHHLHAFQARDLGSVFQMLAIEIAESNVKEMLQKTTQTEISSQLQDEVHVLLLIRQWVLHVFVGNFDISVSLFFWDQLYLSNWSQECFVHVCLVLIYALANDIIDCKSKTELFTVFVKNTQNLQLKTIHQHWKKMDELFGGHV